jgi:hypothetical protein
MKPLLQPASVADGRLHDDRTPPAVSIAVRLEYSGSMPPLLEFLPSGPFITKSCATDWRRDLAK